MASTDQTVTADVPSTYTEVVTKRVAAANGIEYAYRDVGQSEVPVVLLQHFRGNLDNWDPALIDDLAAHRRVVPFNTVGVGSTTGATPNTIETMDHDAIGLGGCRDRSQEVLAFCEGSERGGI